MLEKLKVKIVLPVHNEEVELEENTLKLRNYISDNLKDYDCQIQIADNASGDGTLVIAKRLGDQFTNLSFVRLEQKGRGRAIKKTWGANDADIFIYMDIDLSTDLSHLPNLIKALQNGFDIAIGSRLMAKSKVAGRTIKREIISRVYNFLIKMIFLTKFSDAQCGFKGITAKAADNLLPKIKDNDWFFDTELLVIGEKSGYKIYEEPVIWTDNPGSTVRVLKTITGDFKGLWRLFITKPWKGAGNA